MSAESVSTASPALASLRQQAGTWWLARTAGERRAVTLAAVVLGGFVVWSLAVQPALLTVREAPAKLDRLDTQVQQMQRIAAETGGLRGATRVSQSQAGQALKAATDRLGDRGKLMLQGDRATLTLVGVNPEALRAWLTEARSGARARPIEAQLTRGPQGYSGTLVVTFGGAP